MKKKCNICDKKGHFPKSLNCKKKSRKGRSQKCITKSKAQQTISSEMSTVHIDIATVNKIQSRIQFIEVKNLNPKMEKKCIPSEVIPFFIMFIVLNNDIFKTDQSSLNKIKHQNSQKQYKKSNP